MKKLLIIILGLICFQSKAQDVFPDFGKYKFGLLPSEVQGDTLIASYARFKKKYITSEGCPKGRRVLWSGDDGKSTVSEGIGYGMLMAVYFNDSLLVDDLFRYYKSFPNLHGLMHWKIDGKGGIAGQNAATDAEEDVVFALIIAHERWGSKKGKGKINYYKEAKSLLYKMMDYEVESGSEVLKPGDMWGGSGATNPSYFAPGYYRVYYKFSKNKRWLKVADKCYEIIEKSINKETGLVPDWCNAEGGEATGVGWAREGGKAYLYDAARTPWRIQRIICGSVHLRQRSTAMRSQSS